ncbi:cation diffusion facilitator family transporter [Phyllobacterium sp. 21LDTY02-6]|uniref:cation diffusion facilitator family transporter n=1 Tax=Phyllobacterium sp. 21LDTY02-6 TaxID=2944903 RepID=UPI0020203CAA|nr:cation diffusion facilitator family transporter [Phyllobacterium sp. 21LDTY02-6]MCO4318672.1 cation diffusion facilitator family transporter [Phyllobacterium sp. 21LDTY02-6]
MAHSDADHGPDHGHSHGHDHDHSHGHSHGPGHSHVPKVGAGNERKVLLAFLITFTFMVVEVAGGLISGSLALIADAGHMLTDAAALALSYGAFRFGRRAADRKRTFGYLRFEVIAGLINALALFAILIWISYEAFERFRSPSEILAGPMLLVAIIGLVVNLGVFWILSRGDSEHVNIKGALLHVLGDLLGSVAAIVAAIIIYFTGWTPIDPILSVLVCLLILRSAWSLLRNSLHILLEGAPENAAPEELERHLLQAVPELAGVRHVHVWLITSGKPLATLHVRPRDGADPRLLVQRVENELREKFGIDHATIAIDWPDMAADDCRLQAGDGAHADHDHAEHQHGVHDHAGKDQAGKNHAGRDQAGKDQGGHGH